MVYGKPGVMKSASSSKGIKSLPNVIFCLRDAPNFEIGQTAPMRPMNSGTEMAPAIRAPFDLNEGVSTCRSLC